MEKVNTRHSISRILLLLLVVLFSFSQNLIAQEEAASAEQEQSAEGGDQEAAAAATGGDAAAGKELFNSLCASCHKRYKRSTGPALNGVTDRHETDWLYRWIKKVILKRWLFMKNLIKRQ